MQCPDLSQLVGVVGVHSGWTILHFGEKSALRLSVLQCSKTCGGGSQRRSRQCLLPERQGGLAGCPGEDSETRDCSTNNCPAFTPWSEWSACTVTCGGGQRTAQRECVVARTEDTESLCEGESLRTEECNTGQCEQWTTWAAWTPCTRSCGGGARRRVRQCTLELTRSGEIPILPSKISSKQSCIVQLS